MSRNVLLVSNLLDALSAHAEALSGVVSTQAFYELVRLEADVLVMTRVVRLNAPQSLHVDFDWLRRLERGPVKAKARKTGF